MNSWQSLFDLFIHLDKHLNLLIHNFGNWSYLILFLIIFCETGLVITPFLPGDSLIFTAGAITATPVSLRVELIFLILSLAAISGDSTNYWIGFFLRFKVFQGKRIRFIKRAYLERTQQFYKRHGGKTIILARFIPIVRTFAPFVAGVGEMTYGRFLFFSILGSLSWVAVFSFGGYFFGNLPYVKSHFLIVILAIVFISFCPALIEFLCQYQQAKLKPIISKSNLLIARKKQK